MRRRTTAEERRKIVEAFRVSGLSQNAYSRRHGIALGTLRDWIYRKEEEGEIEIEGPLQDRPLRFVELSSSTVELGPEAVLRIGDQLMLELRQLPTAEYLVELARSLGC